MPDDDTLRRLLTECRTIAVDGLSDRPDRPSNETASYLQRHGYRIVPVNPNCIQVLGQRSYPDLLQAAAALAREGGRIDMVDCFRKSRDIPPIVEQAMVFGPKCVWMQLGIEHPEAAAKARAAGIEVVEDRCVRIEHRRLLA